MNLEKEFNKIKLRKNKYFYPLNSENLRNRDLAQGIKVIFSKQITMSNVTNKFENIFIE